MGLVEEYSPAMAMLGTQVTYAVVTLISRAALLEGMSPRVFIVYRQAVATLFIVPIAYISRSKFIRVSLTLKSFSLIFLSAFVGTTLNLNFYFEGVLLGSSSMATMMSNLTPAVTFVMAAIVGMESVKMVSLRSIAKIGGTVICVSGAMCMAFLRGPKLLNDTQSGFGFGLKSTMFSVENGSSDAWLLGCLCLLGSSCCWALWLILQVPVTRSYPDNLSLSAWMCFFSFIQSIIFTLLVEPINFQTWKIHSRIEVICYIFSGIFGSGIAYFVQAWCIAKRGPVFSVVFTPFSCIVTTIFAAIFLHEEIYTGSLMGGVGVIVGLYIVLWGKAKDYVMLKEERKDKQIVEKEDEHCESAAIITDTHSCKIDLEEPLLSQMCTSR